LQWWWCSICQDPLIKIIREGFRRGFMVYGISNPFLGQFSRQSAKGEVKEEDFLFYFSD